MLYVVFPPRFNIFPFRFHLRNQVFLSCVSVPLYFHQEELFGWAVGALKHESQRNLLGGTLKQIPNL